MLCISIKDNLHLIIGYGKKPNMYILGTLFFLARGKSRSFMSHTKSQILVVFVSSTMFVCLDYGSNIAIYALFIKQS